MAELYVVTVDPTKDSTMALKEVERWCNRRSEIRVDSYDFHTEWKPWAVCVDPGNATALLLTIRDEGVPKEYSRIEQRPHPTVELS